MADSISAAAPCERTAERAAQPVRHAPPRSAAMPGVAGGLALIAGAVVAVVALAGCASLGAEVADGASAQRGRTLAQQTCAACHAIEGRTARTARRAPSFGQIGQRYSRSGLEREVAAISAVGHYAMPRTPLSQVEVESLVAYIHR
jgi:mono/diheme cytochrome c family protein